MTRGPVAIDATPRSEVACNSLVQTDNKLFNKVIIVFSYLCDEATALRDRARDHLRPALLLLADQRALATAAVAGGVATATLAEPPRPEVAANAALPLLLAVQQFSIRVNALAVNLIRQLASLYSPQQKLFAATFRAVTMRRAFDALGDLLGVLILLDDALLRSTHLPEALAGYRRMVYNMTLEPDRYGVQLAQLQELDARIVAISKLLLNKQNKFSPNLYVTCIQQQLDARTVDGTVELNVTTNAPFLMQLLENVKRLLADLGTIIGQPTETQQRDEIVGLVALFCFHQYLHAPTKGVDKKTYTALWALGKRVPLTYMGGVAMWRPLSFLARECPHPPIPSVSTAPPCQVAISSPALPPALGTALTSPSGRPPLHLPRPASPSPLTPSPRALAGQALCHSKAPQ